MNDTSSPSPADPAAKNSAEVAPAPNKKPWRRIVWIVFAAIVLVWATGLIFFRTTIQANVWAWRLESANQPDRDRLVNSLVALGEPAIGPAIRLTHSGTPDVRERGMDVLFGLIEREAQERAGRIQRQGPGKVSQAEILEGSASIDPRIANRFAELLEDPVPVVQVRAIEGVTLGHVEATADTLARLAIRATDPQLASAAALAIDRVSSGQAAEETLRNILAQAAAPDARAQAIASLGMYPSAATRTAIATALSDDRRVTVQPQSILLDPQLMARIARHRGRAESQPHWEPSEPAEPEPSPVTVGDYAARMLEMLTGQSLGIPSTRPEAERAGVIEQYRRAANQPASRAD